MTPDNPQDPQKGKVETTPDEAKTSKAKTAEEKTEAKADATGKAKKSAGEAKPKKPAASKKKEPAAKAKDAAAEETGVDKAAAKAGAEAEDQPKKPGRKKAVTKAETAAKDKPKPAKADATKPSRARRRDAEPALVVRAHAKYVRTSARKARLVCDHIRGKDVADARAILAFTPRGAAEAWSKLLESAVANAEHNHELVGEELRVARVFADEGPTLKRFRPRAMGRATRIRKRTSHLTIELTPKEQ